MYWKNIEEGFNTSFPVIAKTGNGKYMVVNRILDEWYIRKYNIIQYCYPD